MANGISIDKMADAVNAQLQSYARLTATEVKKCVRSAANHVKSEIQKNAPERRGKYKKSWKIHKESETSNKLSLRVQSDIYQLTHLLEYGHKDPTGTYLAAKPYPHIKPAEESGQEKLISDIEKALSSH